MSVVAPTLRAQELSPRYKWLVLTNTTIGVLLATIDSSIMLIAMPDIFRGIKLNPLAPGNTFYLLWMILGFLIVSSVLVVSLGRLGDMYGRVKMYNLGFVIYTVSSLVLTVDPLQGSSGALWLIVGRIFQGIGAAFLIANSCGDPHRRVPLESKGPCVGHQQHRGDQWLLHRTHPRRRSRCDRLAARVPRVGTLWSLRDRLVLRELEGTRRAQPRQDRLGGNVTFALGLILIMVGITYGIEPAGGHNTGWTSLPVLLELGVGLVSVVAFLFIEARVAEPMFRLPLFKIRAFASGTLATFLAAIGRGGLMFMLIIWLQGIWLPLHGYGFERTPLWAGILMLPLTLGFLLAGPLSAISRISSVRVTSRPAGWSWRPSVSCS